MLVDWQPRGSTGGIALTYAPCMRNVLMTLPLSILLLACGDDGEPMRPANFSVDVWESCEWDGQVEPDLCKAEFACTGHGVCAPTCEDIGDCPMFDGFDVECNQRGGTKQCEPRCNASNECPETGGVKLHCSDFYCIGGPPK